MIEWPEDLVSSIARRRAVLYLGAGVSMNSLGETGTKPPSWKNFLQRGIDKCVGSKAEMKRLLKSGDYLTCCQILKYRLGHDWVPFIEDSFLKPKFKPTDIHESILSLDSTIVLTTNFDKIYDNYATAKTNNFLKVKKFYDDDVARALRGGVDQRLILKVHGCIDTPDKLIFTREEYANARNKNANFYKAIDALVLTHTFLFIGCGLNDPDIMLILEQYARTFGASPPHYIVQSGRSSAEYIKMLEDNYNLRVLPYSSVHDHHELTESIINLVSKVEDQREFLAKSRLW